MVPCPPTVYAAVVHATQTPRHRTLIPLVEAALAVMRLSCEKFPVLLSLYVAHLLFWEPPPWAAALVAFNGRLSGAWQRVVLLSFPAVCWVYGAGVVFSTFVSGECQSGRGSMCRGVGACIWSPPAVQCPSIAGTMW